MIDQQFILIVFFFTINKTPELSPKKYWNEEIVRTRRGSNSISTIEGKVGKE